MWKKTLVVVSVLALVMIALSSAVNAQATKIEPRISEKISGKITWYKAAHPEWTERLDKPQEALWLLTAVVVFTIAMMLYTMYTLCTSNPADDIQPWW